MKVVVGVSERKYGVVRVDVEFPANATDRAKKKIAQEAAQKVVSESPKRIRWQDSSDTEVDFGYMTTGDETSFDSGREMLDVLSYSDLYNEATGEYAFRYNESGSIAVYLLTPGQVKELEEKTKDTDESWSSLLGPGGTIYDDPSYEGRNEQAETNEHWCDSHYKGTWRIVKEC